MTQCAENKSRNVGSGGEETPTAPNFPVIVEKAGLTTPAPTGFLFSATDSGYTSSSIFYYDFRTGWIQKKRSGESGDPKLVKVQDQIYLFNRRPESHNYVALDPLGDFANIKGTKQTAIDSGLGDPETVIAGQNGLLISFPYKNYILNLNPKTNHATQVGLFQNTHIESFHPFDLVLDPHDPSRLFVTHVGLGKHSQKPDGSQAIYTFKVSLNGDPLQDTNTEPIPLHSTFGATFFPQSNGTYLLVGLCSDFVMGCTEGLDSFDPVSKTVTQLPISENFPWALNGQIIPAKQDGCFYVQLMHKQNSSKKIVGNLCINKHPQGGITLSVEPIHTYNINSSGTGLLAFELSSESLFVGESDRYKHGLLQVYQNGQKWGPIALDLIPYQGVFL